MIKLNYINKIKANISITSNQKTSNILDGTYKSIIQGKSMNFENLREYVIDDDSKDIDWKSSARSRKLLVRQYIAEKKHNILLVMDNGIKMDADTDKLEKKKEIALYSAGTLGYLAIKNNDYVGMIYHAKKPEWKPFKYNLYSLEQYLCDYENSDSEDNNINDLLKYIVKKIPKRKIVFIITDMSGMDNIRLSTIKRLSQTSDVSLININDQYMTGMELYDISEKNYIPKIFLQDKKLNELEKKVKKKLLDKNIQKFKKNGIVVKSISSKQEIAKKIIELLEEHKYANK